MKTAMMMCVVAMVLVATSVVAVPEAAMPTQLHIYVTGDPSEMAVSYVTQDQVSATMVQWGTSPTSLTSSSTGDSVYFGTDGHMFTQHRGIMTSLKSNMLYFYRVGSGSMWSAVHNFTADKSREGGNIYAAYADFGMANDVSLGELIKEVDNDAFDYVIHAGDQAYDLDSEAGRNGDEFLESIAPIASRVPYMVAPGNHEEHDNFTHYRHRFNAITYYTAARADSNTNLWYSYDIGNTHFVSIDTELYAYYPNAAEQANQLAWLEADLAKANMNRAQVPWIVMYGHKAYWMGNTNYTGFEYFAHKYGVDLYLCGHVHNYERQYPQHNGVVDKACASQPGMYKNPKFMTTIVVGSPGCREHISSELAPAAALATHSDTYGFGRFQVVNATHLNWQWVQTLVPTADSLAAAGPNAAPEELTYTGARNVVDEIWLVQDNHGPREA